MLTLENALEFSPDAEPIASLRNFWYPEPGFVWSQGKWCEVTFDVDAQLISKSEMLEIIIDIDAFKLADKLSGQNVLTYLNGLRIGSSFIEKRCTSLHVILPNLLKAADNILTFDTPDAVCPNEFGVPDFRILGIKLFSVQIREYL